jgi:short-subunit dehydrogenase
MRETLKKTALITGASSGLGNEFCRLFAQDNYNLVLVARNKSGLEKLANELEEKYKIFVKIIVKDLSEDSAAEEIFNETQADKLFINILVNNAGFGQYGNFLETELAHEIKMIQVNIITLTKLTKLYSREMGNNGGGKILNVASTAAFLPGPFMAVYYATKAYVLNFSEALAKELSDSGITVTTFCPGTTKTNFHKNADIEINGTIKEKIIMEAEDAARQGYDGLKGGKSLVIPGVRNKLLTFGIKLVPRKFSMSIINKIQKKSESKE